MNHFTAKNEVLTVSNSFHGRTLACISATGQAKIQAGFGPSEWLPGPLTDVAPHHLPGCARVDVLTGMRLCDARGRGTATDRAMSSGAGVPTRRPLQRPGGDGGGGWPPDGGHPGGGRAGRGWHHSCGRVRASSANPTCVVSLSLSLSLSPSLCLPLSLSLSLSLSLCPSLCLSLPLCAGWLRGVHVTSSGCGDVARPASASASCGAMLACDPSLLLSAGAILQALSAGAAEALRREGAAADGATWPRCCTLGGRRPCGCGEKLIMGSIIIRTD
jgi:hypothetical protein